jgi:medium-chain acyl-[acyl-carrier-protein] hydrolase
MSQFKIHPDSPQIYIEKLRIRSYHTDVNRKLTIPKLCSFFQEVAGNHTVACGMGWKELQEMNLFWVLSRMKIKVLRYPQWQELVSVKTWSNGLSGLFAIRNFLMIDESGVEIIRAVSSWLMVSSETRRLVRADDFMVGFPYADERLFDVLPEKMAPLENPASFEASGVKYTETDMNLHMNNVCYIERIINTFDFDFLKQYEMEDFEINFLKEAIPGDLLMVSTSKVDPLFYFGNIASPCGKNEFVRTAMKWRSTNG